MKQVASILLIIHISAGTISLLLFWLPVIAKKGSKLHNKSGILYVYAMTVVVITAILLCIKNVIIANFTLAAFLGHLSLITAYPLWFGLKILKNKASLSKGFLQIRKLFNYLLSISSIGLLVYAYVLDFQNEAILMVIFALLALPNVLELFKSKEKIEAGTSWIIEHLRGMLISGIAAYTAFFAFGGYKILGNIFTGQWMIIPWILPTIIGVISIQFMKHNYGRKRG